ncbi:MAG: alpha-amylase family glycosyl hydrolase, partial [Verrucomicrobiota bacterium]
MNLSSKPLSGAPGGEPVPTATYRLQFHRDFTFGQAAAIVEYLRALGISHVYASPLFQAGPDSTHGYDICRFDQLNPLLGTQADFDRFSARLRQAGLGLILDMVPNHMGNDPSNAWWMDVLRHGPASPFAAFFDIDWHPLQAGFRDQVLLPILEDHYFKVLEAGKLRLTAENGQLTIAYHDRRFPLRPESYGEIANALREASGVSAPVTLRGDGTDAAVLLEKACHLYRGEPGQASSFDRLHHLLARQHYRLAYWRIGPEAINYRRFFDVTQLVGVRMERPDVFEATHRLVFALLQ